MLAKLIARGLGTLAVVAPLAAWPAQIVIVNGDPPGQGFNDPTPATPIGGNPGTTVGQQTLNVFQRAADVWGARLQSTQPINVIAFFLPLFCNANSAVLGAAGPNWFVRDVPAAPGGKGMVPGTWYPIALAEKLTRQEIAAVSDPPDPFDPFEIFSFFNSELGKPGCFPGNGWYYGLDNNEPSNLLDLLAIVLHEFGHGLGFLVGPTSGNSGARFDGFPSVWERHMADMTTGKRWIDMTNAERAASARNDGNLVWVGQHGSNVVPSVLDFRTEVRAIRPQTVGSGEAQTASFGPLLVKMQAISGTVAAPLDSTGSPLGCAAYPANANLGGKVVLVDRGACFFSTKVLNAQNAGAAAVIIANNLATGLPGMGGFDPTIVIPSFGVTQSYGANLRTAASSASGAFVEIRHNPPLRAGTVANFPRLFAPSQFQPGSSVSHWDTTLTPSQLMEPFVNSDDTSKVKNPEDLTRSLFTDLGW